VLFADAATTESHWVFNILSLLCIPLLVALNGLFVAAEFALVAVRKTRIEELVNQGRKGAKAVARSISHLDRSIAATQLGITLASIALGWTGEPALAWVLQPMFQWVPGGWSGTVIHSVAGTLAFLLITFMHVVFGELIPKSMALQTPDKTALWIAKPLNVFERLTRPLVFLMNGTGNLILRALGYPPARGDETIHSLEELAIIIEDTEEAGLLDPEQAEFVQNVFRFSNKRVGNCMVPREKMAALELNTPPEKVLEAVRQGAHTRIPVYEGQLDNIVGIVNTKDLFYLFSLQGIVVLQDAMYPPLYLGPDDDLGNALELFRRTHRHMAVVRDDQDKVVGLITLEDILEEIVGELEDEHDQPNPRVKVWRRRLATLKRPPGKPAPTPPRPG
jgi:putative hemolysin